MGVKAELGILLLLAGLDRFDSEGGETQERSILSDSTTWFVPRAPPSAPHAPPLETNAHLSRRRRTAGTAQAPEGPALGPAGTVGLWDFLKVSCSLVSPEASPGASRYSRAVGLRQGPRYTTH